MEAYGTGNSIPTTLKTYTHDMIDIYSKIYKNLRPPSPVSRMKAKNQSIPNLEFQISMHLMLRFQCTVKTQSPTPNPPRNKSTTTISILYTYATIKETSNLNSSPM